MPFKNFYKQHPIAFYFFALYLVYLPTIIFELSLKLFGISICEDDYFYKLNLIEVVSKLLTLLGLILLFSFLKFFPVLKSSVKSFKSSFKSTFLIFMFFLIILFLEIFIAIKQKQNFKSLTDIVYNLITVFVRSFIEKLLDCGILANLLAFKHAKTKKGTFFAIFLSSFIFGITYLLNLTPIALLNITTAAKIFAVFSQILYCFMLSSLFTIIYFKCSYNIWVVSILYAFYNYVAEFDLRFLEKNVTFVEYFSKKNLWELVGYRAVQIIILILICLFFLRKNAIEKIIKNIA